MKFLLLLISVFILAISNTPVNAQDISRIEFHLYTDSLKKGVYNYINIDGLLPNNHWLPLSIKEIEFTASAGKWDGNSLIIDSAYMKDSVVITAVLKQNKMLQKNIVVYVKRKPDDEYLKSEEEIMNEQNSKRSRKRKD